MAASDESFPNSRDFFCSKQVSWLKDFLRLRGIQTSGKRKNDLIDLALESQEIKVAKVSELEEPESVASIIKGKLMTKEEGILTNPLETNHAWTNCFNGIPNFGFPDIYNYLVGECSYSLESLKSYKSLLGNKLHYDGHVENLQLHCPPNKNSRYFQFRFSVKPTERSKLEGGETTYKGFFILQPDGCVYSAYCYCKGG